VRISAPKVKSGKSQISKARTNPTFTQTRQFFQELSVLLSSGGGRDDMLERKSG
jgi:hypothetical protein